MSLLTDGHTQRTKQLSVSGGDKLSPCPSAQFSFHSPGAESQAGSRMPVWGEPPCPQNPFPGAGLGLAAICSVASGFCVGDFSRRISVFVCFEDPVTLY